VLLINAHLLGFIITYVRSYEKPMDVHGGKTGTTNNIAGSKLAMVGNPSLLLKV